MSHYVEIKSQYKSQEALVAALEEIVGKGNVEVHASPQTIVGYNGRTDEACHVIVRRSRGRGSLALPEFGDLGFRRNADGTYTQIIDSYDARRFSALPQRYARAVTIQQARRQGFTVTETQQPDGALRLTLTRY